MITSDLQTIKKRFGIIGNSDALNRAINIALQVANTDLSVLVNGESGVGKEFFPQIVHQFSSRKHNAYIAVNCGAIPEGTIDSELFGHVKGSFTGALSNRKGYFEVADSGTIFLDEVGELPLATQARLLRVLETGEFLCVGSSQVQKTNVRIVAATNLDMQTAISQGKFREDLYYRLNTIPIKVPCLRDRGPDIYLLFRKFAADMAEKYRMPTIQLSEKAKEVLLNYRWPGNIRQLKNITEQISVIEQERLISESLLKKYLPNIAISKLPALFVDAATESVKSKVFNSEREILYKVLFDMRKDVTDLKALVNHLMDNKDETKRTEVKRTFSSDLPLTIPTNSFEIEKKSGTKKMEEVEYVVEEPISLEDAEKELIKRTLLRNQGRRKAAADDLKISPRTLYRKIKDYELE